MSRKTIIPIMIIIGAVFIVSILINFYLFKIKKDTFEIGMLNYDRREFELAATDFPYTIKLVQFDAEDELLQAYLSNDIDAIVIDGFSYVKQYGDFQGGRAVLSKKTPFIIKKSDLSKAPDKIGSAYEWLLVNYNTHARNIFKNTTSALNALLENQVDEVLLPEKMLENASGDSTITHFGDIEMLLIVNSLWLHKDQDESLDLIRTLEQITSDQFITPTESGLNAIVTKLFSSEIIETRYYYKDLVYTTDTR